jgi:hypothetical protein
VADEKYGSAEQILALPASAAIAILKDPAASVYARAKACMRLAVVGDRAAVPLLAGLLQLAELSDYARFGLEPIPHPEADAALRAAAEKLAGKQLVGVVNSIAARRDTAAIPLLQRLRSSADPEVAKAADVALAKVRPGR